jgi:hypothetical protein
MSTDAITRPAGVTGSPSHLEAELLRLRILLERRVLWLRQQWRRDPLAAYHGAVISDQQADSLFAGEDREAEHAFYESDARAQSLTRALKNAEEQKRALLEESRSPVETIAGLFRLSRFECDVLLMALAAEIDPAFERLYAYAQDDAARRYVTPHLAVSLLCSDEVETALASFLPGGVLRRYALISMDDGDSATGLVSRALRIDERITQYLLGVDRLDERVAAVLLPVGPAAQTPKGIEAANQLTNLLMAPGGPSRWKALHLSGPPDAGKRAVAAAVCERLGLRLCAVDSARLHASGSRRELLMLMERDAILSGVVYHFDLDRPSAGEREQLAGDLARFGILYITGSRERRQAGAVLSMEIAPPDSQMQVGLWQEQLTGCAAEVSEETIAYVVEQFHFGPAHIASTIETAHQLAALRAGDSAAAIIEDDLWRACRMQSGRELDELAQRIHPCHDWNDLILPRDTFHQLREVVAQVANRAFVYERWGFGRKLNRGRGVAALFAGQSGTGKTLAAEVLAEHLRLDLYRIDLSAVVSKYIGETEKNLRRVFEAAERCGAVLLFDECDALFARRSEVKDSLDRYANLEVNYLLQRMEDYHGLAVLATNRRDMIDDAFLRRLRFIIEFPFPDSKQRSRIWQSMFPHEAPLHDIDFEALARLEIPGGNIRNIAFNAAFQAAADGSAITMLHVMRAARREYQKISKLMREAEFGHFYGQVQE